MYLLFVVVNFSTVIFTFSETGKVNVVNIKDVKFAFLS